jgi:hypothetical protein
MKRINLEDRKNLLEVFKIRMLALAIIAFNIFTVSQVQAQTNVSDLKFDETRSVTVYNNELWLYGNFGDEQTDIWKSANGTNWVEVASTIDLNSSASGIAFNGKLYSIGGRTNSAFSNQIKTSTDGINWVTHTANFSPRSKMESIIHNGDLYVLGGTGSNDVWSSSDGINWIQKTNQISTDFPHFWEPKAVSLNGKIILFGGHKTDFGFIDNERGVYISSNNGTSFQKHTFPYPVNLDNVNNYAVYKNKLWVTIDISSNHLFTEGSPFSPIKRLFWTEDGITWHEEPNGETSYIENNDVLSKSIVFDNKIFNYSRKSSNVAYYLSMANFTIPNIVLPTVTAQLIRQSDVNQLIIPFNYQHLIAGEKDNISFTFSSSNSAVVNKCDISVANNQLHILPTGITGETKITITATDGTETESLQIPFFVYPDENVWFKKSQNIIVSLGSTVPAIILKSLKFNNFNANSYIFSSSNSAININNIMYEPHVFRPGHDIIFLDNAIDNAVPSETELTITATDGATSYNQSVWIKIGDNSPPVIQNSLADYTSPTTALSYQIPANAFQDPENQMLTFTAEDLPCELHLDASTGLLTGTLIENSYTIEIIATDRYGESVRQELIVNKTISSVDDVLNSKTNFQIFPNPAIDYCNIKFNVPEDDRYTVRLYSLQGKLISILTSKRLSPGKTELKIDVKKYNSGLYILAIEGTKGKLHRPQKLIIK